MANSKDSWANPPAPQRDPIKYSEVKELEEGYRKSVEEDPRYSLEIDPQGTYHFSSEEKDLIEGMIQYKNVQFVSTVLMNIPIEQGIAIYRRYNVQAEIRRINLAMYARRFSSKMADLNEIGGYLTSGLIDENVPIADRWSPKEKLTAAKLLMTLNAMKKEGLESPDVIDEVEVKKDLDKLSPLELEKLIEYSGSESNEKKALVDEINEGGFLSPEEVKNLETMPLSDLKALSDDIKKRMSLPNEPEE